MIPGGFAPESLRRNADVLKLVRGVHDAGNVVAAVCHAGWVLASAGIAAGRTLTSVSIIRDNMVNAGAHYSEDNVVRDGNLVTARLPNDVGFWCREVEAAIADLPERSPEEAPQARRQQTGVRRLPRPGRRPAEGRRGWLSELPPVRGAASVTSSLAALAVPSSGWAAPTSRRAALTASRPLRGSGCP